MIAVGRIVTMNRAVSAVFDVGSRWRVAELDGTYAVLHRVGLRGQRLTSRWKINEYRLESREVAWLVERGHAKIGG